MKSAKQITKLNFNDIAFFKGIKTSEAKWLIAPHFFGTESILDDNLTKSGIPKIKATDLVHKSDFETKIKSNSNIEGKNNIDYHIAQYNKGVPLNTLREYSQNPSFRSALRFTGKFKILNEILNSDQLLKVQKSWLLANTYMKNHWDDKTTLFVIKNKWTKNFLIEKGIDKSKINEQILKFKQSK